MKIDINVKGSELTIKDLKKGETFEYDNGIYISTDEFHQEKYRICVNLSTGSTMHFNDTEIMTLGPKLKIVLDE